MSPPRSPSWSAAPFCGAGAAGCFHGPTPAEEQQSVAEQDLAGDAFNNGRLREAFDHVQRALKLNPDNGEAAYLGATVLLGFCAARRAPRATAASRRPRACARKAIDASPDHRDAKNALGVILVHEQRYDDAITVLKPLTEDLVYGSPENAWGNLGWAYLAAGQHGRGD